MSQSIKSFLRRFSEKPSGTKAEETKSSPPKAAVQETPIALVTNLVPSVFRDPETYTGDKLIVQITTGPDNHGLVNVTLHLTLFHSESLGSDATVHETDTSKVSKLAFNPEIIGKDASKNTFYVTASAEIFDNVHAIAINSLSHDLEFESVVIKRERDGEFSQGWYFPTTLPTDKNVPKRIIELREDDFKGWRTKYTAVFKMEGMPVGAAVKKSTLFKDEAYNDTKNVDFTANNLKGMVNRGVAHLLTYGTDKFTSLQNMEETLYSVEPKPDIANTWREDSVFATQLVSGVHPVMIRALPRTTTFPLSILPDLTIAQLSQVKYLQGRDIMQEIQAGHFIYLDYRPYLGKFVTSRNEIAAASPKDQKRNGYLAAPVALIYHNTQESQLYPIAIRFLRHHFTSLMNTNAIGRELLIGAIMTAMSTGDAFFDVMKHMYAQWDFMKCDPVSDLEERGFTGDSEAGSSLDGPGQYPWAEDARDLYKVIQSYAADYINLYYETDESVTKDYELQRWIQETAVLHIVLSNLVWTCTAQHACMNFSQYMYSAYPPNRPPKSLSPPLKSYSEVVDEARLKPALGVALLLNLSFYEPNEVYIGQRMHNLHGPSETEEAAVFEKFGDQVREYGNRVEHRNKTLNGRVKVPYIWLAPEKVTNNIGI
ncbi:Lipoxygenase [Rhizoclosmatium globosum]|uniref:Manganese lipoxygenase n=1 Tax=Rhizoclosmatium globosum TaxID=329046 RepID=A0A1Y2B9N4_9FUNG|nr:Lipoxygenase [Rhizoclosmatium globosum]|eukprot:ORY31562.1 Lipoxygenase [Rhizoclosmatium globosum]